ncbi:hypothetical protein K438DRAFT_1759082 [Mycena galopus ATCC 62051]|nr:hypothetical protein K438DRAFT_1759082 [Mycena galopus ATCC 62051]
MSDFHPQKVYNVVVVVDICTQLPGEQMEYNPQTIEVLCSIGRVSTAPVSAGSIAGQSPIAGGGVAKKMISQGVRFIDVVDNYMLLLRQGLIENVFLDEIESCHTLLLDVLPTLQNRIFRLYMLQDCQMLPVDVLDPLSSTHSVECVIEHSNSKSKHTIHSHYLLGCDGTKSHVHWCIAGSKGEVADIIWGVLYAQVKTNFPHIKYKCLIHSKSKGSITIIPCEANLVRFYVQLQTTEGGKAVSITRDKATQDICIVHTKKIFELEFGYIEYFTSKDIYSDKVVNLPLEYIRKPKFHLLDRTLWISLPEHPCFMGLGSKGCYRSQTVWRDPMSTLSAYQWGNSTYWSQLQRSYLILNWI